MRPADTRERYYFGSLKAVHMTARLDSICHRCGQAVEQYEAAVFVPAGRINNRYFHKECAVPFLTKQRVSKALQQKLDSEKPSKAPIGNLNQSEAKRRKNAQT